jgi:hypothetical protein
MSFANITLCVASQQVSIFVRVYFVIDSVRKLLDTPSYSVLKQLRVCRKYGHVVNVKGQENKEKLKCIFSYNTELLSNGCAYICGHTKLRWLCPTY